LNFRLAGHRFPRTAKLAATFVVVPAPPALEKVGQSSGDEKRQSGACTVRSPRSLLQRMIPKSGSRFSEKIMLQRKI
jgi:hypothetical protein